MAKAETVETTKKLVIGLDLSLNGTGIIAVECDGFAIKILEQVFVDNHTIKAKDIGMKLFNVYYAVETVVEKYIESYDCVHIVKEKGFSRFAKATEAVNKVSGVVDLSLYILRTEVLAEYAPTTVKKAITGKGNASKEEVQEEVRQFLVSSQADYEFLSQDTSDALAVAVTHLIVTSVLEAGGGEQ
jgi:crossover junction endodeoxyribonuclease RuvC